MMISKPHQSSTRKTGTIVDRDEMDRISQLPEYLIEKILIQLPAEDAVCTSFLSKTWKTFWDSLPKSQFDLDIVGRSPEESVAFVDESLSILQHQPEDYPKHIVFCTLRARAAQIYDQIDDWIKLVFKHYVKNLSLYFQDAGYENWYKFPPARLDFGSLVVLNLSKCILMWDLVHGDTRFRCLRELMLAHSDLNGLTEELLSRCPSLENLELIYYRSNQAVSVCGLTNLKKFVLHHGYDPLLRKIEAVNLESLDYWSPMTKALTHGDICCPNLKELTIRVETIPWVVQQYYVTRYIIPQFPLLEKLFLHSFSYVSTDTVLEVSSHRLKSLVVSGYWKINLKTPNLVYCKLEDYKVPSSILSKNRKQQILVDAESKTITLI